MSPEGEGFTPSHRETVSGIKTEKDAEKKILFYRGLEFISHSDVAEAMLMALKDASVREFHRQARQAIIRLCQADHSKWDLVVRHLCTRGSRLDRRFFEYWKSRPGQISASQVRRLRDAHDLWVRAYTIDAFGDPVVHLQSLRNEVDDLLRLLDRAPAPIASTRPEDH